MGGNWKCNPASAKEANSLLKEWKKLLAFRSFLKKCIVPVRHQFHRKDMEGHPMNAQCSFLLLRGLPNVDKSASAEQEPSCRITWNLTGHWGSLGIIGEISNGH